MLVAFLGTLHTLLISVLLRRREIGLLRAIGGSLRVVARMIRLEGALLGLMGGLFGLLFGFGTADVALGLLSLEEQGFRPPVSWSGGVAWLVLGAAMVTGWIAGIVPSREAARTDVLDAIGEE